MFYMAGIGAYRQKLGEVANSGYDGFEMTRESDTASNAAGVSAASA